MTEVAAVSSAPKEFRLTEQERMVIKHIISGKCNREIAHNMFLGEGRVKNIVSSVLKKLELKDRTQLAIYVLQNNILDA